MHYLKNARCDTGVHFSNWGSPRGSLDASGPTWIPSWKVIVLRIFYWSWWKKVKRHAGAQEWWLTGPGVVAAGKREEGGQEDEVGGPKDERPLQPMGKSLCIRKVMLSPGGKSGPSSTMLRRPPGSSLSLGGEWIWNRAKPWGSLGTGPCEWEESEPAAGVGQKEGGRGGRIRKSDFQQLGNVSPLVSVSSRPGCRTKEYE